MQKKIALLYTRKNSVKYNVWNAFEKVRMQRGVKRLK